LTKDEMVSLLRSVATEEKIITAMESAWELGAEWEREECLCVVEGYFDEPGVDNSVNIAKEILERGMK